MIIRIVKMVFREEEIPSFRQLFEERKSLIRNFEGCTHLELWQDKSRPNIFFTYSWWDSEEHLEHYRIPMIFTRGCDLTFCLMANAAAVIMNNPRA